jgi:hypothetical protein
MSKLRKDPCLVGAFRTYPIDAVRARCFCPERNWTFYEEKSTLRVRAPSRSQNYSITRRYKLNRKPKNIQAGFGILKIENERIGSRSSVFCGYKYPPDVKLTKEELASSDGIKVVRSTPQ